MDQGKSCAKAERSREAAAARRRRFGNEGNLAPADRGDFSILLLPWWEPPTAMGNMEPEVGAEESEVSFSDEKEDLR